MTALKQLTLVMPTYNRQQYALRAMRYWSGTEPMVYVLDGSPDPIPPVELEGLDPNIQYCHRPIPIRERFAMAADLVSTEFAAFLCDDEFYLPSGLEACIQTIEAEGLTACLGRSLYFNVFDGRLSSGPLEAPFTDFANYGILQGDPRSRVLAHAAPYLCTTIYGVHRAAAWRRSVRACIHPASCFYAIEILFELAAAYQGKSRVIDTLMWLRSFENRTIQPPGLTFEEWSTAPRYEAERAQVLDHVAGCLEGEPSAIRDAMRAAMERFTENSVQYHGARLSTAAGRLQEYRFRLRDALPPRAERTLRRIRNRFVRVPDLVEMGSAWKQQGIAVNVQELAKVQDQVARFHGNDCR